MASRLTEEEENYVRMSLLLTGISPRAARALFDREFAPACLDSSLKKEYKKLKDLQKRRIINQKQWNLLFPRYPDVLRSQTFDVTLMTTLLRNLTTLPPPHGGYDLLPSQNETTAASDLARIKYYRNFLAHLDEGEIDDTMFITAWDDITGAVSRLGGHTMKLECDSLKTKILDQTKPDVMGEIERSNDEMRDLKQSVEGLKIANADLTAEVDKLKDTVPWNLRAQISQNLLEWKDNELMFITTRAAKQVLTCIKENSCVTITASSGVGKTTTLRHVSLQMAKEGYDVLPVTDPGDIVKFYNPTRKTLFVIDDLCGNYSLNQTDLKVWEPCIEQITKILLNKLAKLIVACRLQLYQDDKFESLLIFKSCVCNLLSDSMCLSTAEKESIADVYLKTEARDISDCYDLYDCFPLLCKLYQKNPSLNITDFFRKPFLVYEAEIDKLKKKGFFSKYCALALCVMFNNNLKEKILVEEVNEETKAIIENTCEACNLDKGTSRLTLQGELNSFIQTFLRKEQGKYKTIHDKIFDFLVYYFGQKMIYCLIKNAHISLIKERFLLEKQANTDQFISIVPLKYHQMYIQRMVDEWSKGEVIEVFCNINMAIPKFRQRFLCHLNGLDTGFQRQLAHTCDVRKQVTVLLQLCFRGDIPMISWCFDQGVDVNQCRDDELAPLHVAASKGWTEIEEMLLKIGADYDTLDNKGWSPVMFACRNGHTETVRMLLNIGADYNKHNNNGWSPVMCACKHGHADIVRMLLDKGADYNKCNTNDRSPIMCACRYGHIEIVRMMLDIGADYNKCNTSGRSPLLIACKNGHVKIVRMLLDKAGDYNRCDNSGRTPLMFASRNGHTRIVKMLLDKGADYDKCNYSGFTPVMYACKYGLSEIVKMLLDKGADYKTCNGVGWSPVMIACRNGHKEIVRMLLDTGADYNKCDSDGFSLVMCACSEGHTGIVSMLLDIGADYNRCDNNGWLPIMSACKYGHTEIVRMLFNIGADYGKCDNVGCSPVMTACRYGHTEIVRMLLNIGADYNKCDNVGLSPIMISCRNGYTDIVRMLLEKGADYNKCDNKDWSSIMLAFRYGHTEIVRIFLDVGADINKCNNNGWSPIMLACRYKHTEIVRILLDREADYNLCNNDGWSPVMSGCRYGHTEIVRMLLDKGGDFNKCNNDGWSSLMSACRYGHTEIVRMLLDIGADYNKCNRDGVTPVMSACSAGHAEIVKMLLDIGADYNKCDNYGCSPILFASERGHSDIVSMVNEHSRKETGT